jgi:hypothetical protein
MTASRQCSYGIFNGRPAERRAREKEEKMNDDFEGRYNGLYILVARRAVRAALSGPDDRDNILQRMRRGNCL